MGWSRTPNSLLHQSSKLELGTRNEEAAGNVLHVLLSITATIAS
jgi:hypothetical protein